MTTLYLIRHGIAAERGTYAEDGDRPLTAAGLQKTRQVAQRWLELGVRCDRLLTSPLVRAHQTAELLVEIGIAPKLHVVDYLAPNGKMADWLTWQQSTPVLNAIGLVGHEPDLSTWAEHLLWGDFPAPQGALTLKKAGIIGLSLPDSGSPLGHSSLFWLTPPRLLLD